MRERLVGLGKRDGRTQRCDALNRVLDDKLWVTRGVALALLVRGGDLEVAAAEARLKRVERLRSAAYAVRVGEGDTRQLSAGGLHWVRQVPKVLRDAVAALEHPLVPHSTSPRSSARTGRRRQAGLKTRITPAVAAVDTVHQDLLGQGIELAVLVLAASDEDVPTEEHAHEEEWDQSKARAKLALVCATLNASGSWVRRFSQLLHAVGKSSVGHE